MTSARLRIALAWLPAAAYTLLIWYLSSQALNIAIIKRIPFQDKGVHFLEYGALCFFLVHAVTKTWPGRGAAGYFVAMLMTVALGLLDELHQGFVPGRSSDVLDLAADAIGAAACALGYALASQLVRLFARAASSSTDAARRWSDPPPP